MQFRRLLDQHRSNNLDGALPSLEDRGAGKVEGRVLRMIAGDGLHNPAQASGLPSRAAVARPARRRRPPLIPGPDQGFRESDDSDYGTVRRGVNKRRSEK
jgi:hypothetical protein